MYNHILEHQQKVLLVLDGFDEYSGGKSSPVHEIWRGTRLRDCTVLVTTRPTKRTDQLRRHSHVQFELNGFDSGDKIEDFVRKFLSIRKTLTILLHTLLTNKTLQTLQRNHFSC